MKQEAKYLYNGSEYSYSRRGLTISAVFLLSLFVGKQDKPVFGVGCRSPPFNLDFLKKIQIGGQRYGLKQSQRRKEMAALERSRGKETAGIGRR